jgi:hypothetical protein
MNMDAVFFVGKEVKPIPSFYENSLKIVGLMSAI